MSKDSVEKGETVTFTWETENASKVMLGKAGSTDFKEVQASGTETVVIDKPSTYVLMASSKYQRGQRKLKAVNLKLHWLIMNLTLGVFMQVIQPFEEE